MTYNGVGMVSTKGTGLSGYIQRSRVAVRQSLTAPRSSHDDTNGLESDRPTPLEAARSVQENQVLATLLAQHDRLRLLKLQVLDHQERRTADGVDAGVVRDECKLMGEALVAQYREEKASAERERQVRAKARGAEAFAEAFSVTQGGTGSGDAFDRKKRDDEKSKREAARRVAAETKLLDRAKKMRLE